MMESRERPLVSLRNAMSRLKRRTDDNARLIDGFQEGSVKAIVKIPQVADGYLIIPKDYWRNFNAKDFYRSKEAKKGFVPGEVIEIQLGAVRELYDLVADLAAKLFEGDAVRLSDISSELHPWFAGMEGRSDAESDVPIEVERAHLLIVSLLRSADLVVPIQVYEPNFDAFVDLMRVKFMPRRSKSLRPIDDLFWYELIRFLDVKRIGSGQPALKNHLNKYCEDNKIPKPDIKTITERLWAENDFEKIHRSVRE